MAPPKYKTVSLTPKTARMLTAIMEQMEEELGMTVSYSSAIQRLCTLYGRGELASVAVEAPDPRE